MLLTLVFLLALTGALLLTFLALILAYDLCIYLSKPQNRDEVRDRIELFIFGYRKTRTTKFWEEERLKMAKEKQEQIAFLKETIQTPVNKSEDYFIRGYQQGLLHVLTHGEFYHQGKLEEERDPPCTRDCWKQLKSSLERIEKYQPRTNECEVFGYCYGILTQRFKGYWHKYDELEKMYALICKHIAHENWMRIKECVAEIESKNLI